MCAKKVAINPTYLSPAVDSVALSNQPVQTQETVFQLVNTSCSFIQAFHYCQSHFSSLTFRDQKEDEEGMRNVLAQTGMHHPVWVRDHKKVDPTAAQSLSKQSKSPEEI